MQIKIKLFCILFFLNFEKIQNQFISTTGNSQVNRPLQRWEQFQKQLRLNQININPPTNNFANFVANIKPNNRPNENNLNLLLGTTTLFKNINDNSNQFSKLKNDNQVQNIFLSENNFRDLTDNGFIGTTNSLNAKSTNSLTEKKPYENDNVNFYSNNAFSDLIKSKNFTLNNDFYANNLINNSSSSNSIQTKAAIDNFKELNNNLTKNHYIELSKKFMNLTLSLTDSQFRDFLKFVHELSGKINSDCMSTLISLFYGVRRQQSWALKFIDSTGFFPRGIIDGTFTSLGEYDQCISIQVPGELVKRNKEKNPDVFGKYCLTKLHLTKYNLLSNDEKRKYHKVQKTKLKYGLNNISNVLLENNTSSNIWSVGEDNLDINDDEMKKNFNQFNLDKFKYNDTVIQNTVFENISKLGLDLFQHIHAFRIGICAPSTCSNSDINIFLNKILNEYKVYAQVSSKCDSNNFYQSNYNSKFTVIAIFIMLMTTSMVALGTFLDFIRRKQARCGVYPTENLTGKLVRCWSIKTAIYRLTKCNCEHQTELYPIHGLKVLLSIWLIWSSTYLFGIFYSILWMYKRLIIIKEMPKNFWFQLISNSWLIADSLFFLSGLLLVYVGSLILSKNNGKSKFFLYILQRIIRLLPSLIGLFCFYLIILNYAHGPVLLDDNVKKQLIKNCEKNWWKTLLFFNNLDEPKHLCLPHTWFLAANVQLSIIFYPIVMILNQRTKITVNLLLLIILISIFYSAFLTYDSNLNGMILPDQLTNLEYINYHLKITYFSTFQHLTSYALGLLTGSLILNRPFLLKKISSLMNFCFWMISIIIISSIIFLPYIWNNQYPTKIESTIYACLHRPIYLIGFSFLTYSMINGKAKFFTRLFCANIFVPISRLSLATYLIHLPVVYLKFYTSKTTIVYSNLDFFFSTVTIYFSSLAFAVLLYICFQNPFESMLKVLFQSSKESNNIFNYEKSYKTPINSTIQGLNSKNCHCGKSADRLATKVNLDFSSFGIKSPKTLNSVNNSPEFSSSTKSINVDYPDSSNFLVNNTISYNTNGEAELTILDKVDGINYTNTLNKPFNSNFSIAKFCEFSNENSNSLSQTENNLRTYSNYQINLEKNFKDKELLKNITSRNAIYSGLNNHLGNNVANEIRKKLEQIKQTANKSNQSQTINLFKDLNKSSFSNIKEETEDNFDFYSTNHNESFPHSLLFNNQLQDDKIFPVNDLTFKV